MKRPWVLAITGASGSIYAVRLLQQMLLAEERVQLIISGSAHLVIQHELGIETQDLVRDPRPLLRYRSPLALERWQAVEENAIESVAQSQLAVHPVHDFLAPVASGSFLTQGMIVCPCSGATLSGIVHAAGNNLIHRSAEVHLKERRKLILVPRETPLSTFHIENMHRASQAGAIVLPAMPGWYHRVESIIDLVDFVVARILDQLGIPHRLLERWGAENQGTDNIYGAQDDLKITGE